MKRVGIGIIGCGYIADAAHIPNILSMPEAKIIAIADNKQEIIDKISNKYAIQRSYTDYRQMLENPEVDAVIISTPSNTHARIAIDAANAGKHIFVEKPMAPDLKDAYEMVEASNKNNVKLMIGYQSRFLPNHIRAKKIIQKGELGDIFYSEFHSETLISKPEDGVLVDYGVHLIDLMCWYFDNLKVKKVGALMHSIKDYQKETEVTITVQFDNGMIGRIGAFWLDSWKSWAATDRHIQIIGTKGKILTDFTGPTFSLYKDGSLLSRIKGINKIMPEYTVNKNIPFTEMAYRKEMENFIESILKNKEPYVTGNDGIKVMKIVDTARASAAESRFIEVN
jgi:predicted dehydrogenase